MLKYVRPPEAADVGAQEFRAALAQFASGVTVITTLDPAGATHGVGAAHGMTATAFSSLSLDPPLILVAVARDSRCHRQVLAARRFGVSILREDQAPLSRHFGKRGGTGLVPRFVRLGAVAILEDAMVALACELEDVTDGGDHTIFIGRVTATRRHDGPPLVHYEGAYRALSKDIL